MPDDITIVVRAEDRFSNVLGNFGNIMTGIKSVIDLAGSALRTFGGFASEGLTAIASYERLSASLTSLTASQLLQAGAADTSRRITTLDSGISNQIPVYFRRCCSGFSYGRSIWIYSRRK